MTADLPRPKMRVLIRHVGAAIAFLVLQLAAGLWGAPPSDCRGGVVFDSDRTQLPAVYRTADLYFMSADGRRERRLTFAGSGEFSRTPKVSLDGRRVAFHGKRAANGEGLYVLTCHDDRITWLTPTSASPGPAWSPDGREIAFTTGTGTSRTISIVDVATGGVRTLEGMPRDSSGPAWSPDGRHIAFTSKGSVTWEIFAIEIASGRVRQLTHTRDVDTASQAPAWSPDGSTIAFDRARGGDFDVYVMNADGSGLVQLTHERGIDARPAWSAEGRAIAFHSNRSRPLNASAGDTLFLDIYVMAPDGSNVRRLTANQYFDGHPSW